MMEFTNGMILSDNEKIDSVIKKMASDDFDAASPVAINQIVELAETRYIAINDSTRGPIFGSRACFDCTIDIGK
jgi:hypothetical protein